MRWKFLEIKIRLLLVLIWFFLFSCIKENEGNISLSSEKNFFKVKTLNFYKTDKLLGLEELSRLANENKFTVKTGEYMSFGITQDFVYLYFDIEREDQSEWILELPYPPLIYNSS